MENELVYKVALNMVPGIGSVLARNLLSYCGTARQVFARPKGKLMRIPGIGEKIAANIVANGILQKAEKEVELAAKNSVQLLFFTDDAYPKRLKDLQDAPILLYKKGNANLNAAKSLAIVGTRHATSYGREVVEQVVADLKRFPDVHVVSGLAYGIDIAAHRACLKQKVPTLAVMGTSMDSIYPPAHQKTAHEMLETGALLSEYSFGTKAKAQHFPERNRLIAGLCDALLLVESAEKGGGMITAEIAYSYQREVFAVPGKITDTYSKGCNHLLKSLKANIFLSVDNLEYMLNWSAAGTPSSLTTRSLPEDLSEQEALICQTLEKGPMHIDDLSIRTQIPLAQIASILLELEFKDCIKTLPGKQFGLA